MKEKRKFLGFYFSYGQIIVTDTSQIVGLNWEKAHILQGFARRNSTIAFATMMEFGHSSVSIINGSFVSYSQYSRVVSVPFMVSSGSIAIVSPDDNETIPPLTLPQGHYRITCAQYVSSTLEEVENDEGEEVIDLYFELLDEPIHTSKILVADKDLNPPDVLLETAEIAGEE